MVLQPLDIGIQRVFVQRMVKAIMGERYFAHVLVEGLILSTIESHAWLCPVGNPKGIISGCSGRTFCNQRDTAHKERCDRNENKSVFHWAISIQL